MLRVALLDANAKASKEYAGQAVSVVSGWLRWEMGKAGVEESVPAEADVLFVVCAGAIDYRSSVASEFRRFRIEPNARRRDSRPYCITGGPVDSIPLTALALCDALVVGEGYRFVRSLLALVANGATIKDVRAFVEADPHAIERRQVERLERAPERPWLLARPAPKLASPDPFVDWDAPPVKSDDGVVRIIAEKGCHMKCTYCATTYRQAHVQHPDGERVVRQLAGLAARGNRVQLVSNDPMHLPWFRKIRTRLSSQSFTIQEVSDPENRKAIIEARPGIARFGVEGLSERIRRAFAKPISNTHLLEVLEDLHSNRINTHLFLIVGAPGETAEDWAAWRDFHETLARRIRFGVCRLKFTTFNPSPPAPLARFVPGDAYHARQKGWIQQVVRNWASSHVLIIKGRGPASRIADVADLLSVPEEVALRLGAGEGTDLAPTVEDAARLPWEIIEWPISTAKRWGIAGTYARRMAVAGNV